jgi:hypothetical protein
MFETIHGWIQAHPLTSAVALCYLLTFVAVRQIKPLLPHFEVTVRWLPQEFRKRLILRGAVFACGSLVSVIVACGLVVFQLVHLTVAKVAYIALSVGFLAPFVYDLLLGTITLLEFMKVLPKGISKKIRWLIDPEKVEIIVDNAGDIEKVRDHGQTIWTKRKP